MNAKHVVACTLTGLTAVLAFSVVSSFRTSHDGPIAIPTVAATSQDVVPSDTFTVTRPIRETHTRDVTYAVTKPVREHRTQTISYSVMTVVHEKQTRIEPITGKEITYTVARHVPEKREKTIEYVVTNMVPEQRKKTIEYQTVRYETTTIPQ